MGIRTPPEYEHPSKREGRGSKNEQLTSARAEKTEIPIRKKEGDERGPNPRLLKPASVAPGEQVHLRVVAYEPRPGELKRFDEMIGGGITNKDALLGLLRNARHKIDDLAKRSSKQVDDLTYDHGSEYVETNWSLSERVVGQLKSVFDPFDILTPRALGAKIGAAVIVLNDKE